MSFSSEVKKELCGLYGGDRHCDIAELAAIINTCGEIYGRNHPLVKVQTENAAVAKKYFMLLKKTFGFNADISIRHSKQFKKNRIYTISLGDGGTSFKLLHATGLLDDDDSNDNLVVKRRINPTVVGSVCCMRAYIRGAFISGGSLSDPEKTYHMEFINSDRPLSVELSEHINYFGLSSKVIKRKGHFVVYLKEGEQIVDALNIMGAHVSLMDLENVRILKFMRNSVNRIVNCEYANINKTVGAAQRQLSDIEFISREKGLNILSDQLYEVANARILNPELSLKEIGAMLSPPVGKSGVNHRLRKISEIADNLRGGLL